MHSVFITGIGGFIGLRSAQRFVERGIRVVGLDASPEAVARARAHGIEAQRGDINQPETARPLLANVDTVLHTAALVKENGSMDLFRRLNVEGPRTMAKVAREAGVETFVHLSSVMVYGFDFPQDVAEDGPLDGAGNPYCTTKIESEEAVLAEAARDFGVIVIRPGDVYGPGATHWIGRQSAMLQKRMLVLPAFGKGVINHVYVDNLIDGISLAIEKKAYGEAFNVTDGVATTYLDFYRALARRAGLPDPTPLPTPVVRGLVRAMSFARKLGLPAEEADEQAVRYLLRKNRYSIRKAEMRLGYRPRVGLDEGLERSAPYARAEARRAIGKPLAHAETPS